MKEAKTALLALLQADAQLTAIGSTGVFHKLAPQNQGYPFTIIQKMNGDEQYDHEGLAWVDLVYLVKGIAKATTSKVAEDIDDRCKELLVGQRLVTEHLGYHCHPIFRRGHVSYAEDVDGVTYQHEGARYSFRLVPMR